MSIERRKAAELWYWLIVFLFLLIFIPFRFYWPSADLYRDTYQLPVGSPGAHTTDIWNWRFVIEGMYTFAPLIVYSGLFMIWTRNKVGRHTHTFFLFVFLIWFTYVLVNDIVYLNYANVAPAETGWIPDNPATDRRWCCVYGTHLGTEYVCANTVPCAIPDLRVEPKFIFRFVCNILLMAYILLADMVFTFAVWRPRLDAYLQDVESESVKDIGRMVVQRRSRHARYNI